MSQTDIDVIGALRCPLNFGPRQVPAVRDWMSNAWKPGGIARSVEVLAREQGRSQETTPIELTARRLQDNLRSAVMYWVSGDMCDLLDAARDSVPTDVSLTEEILPDSRRAGLAFFQKSIRGYESYGVARGERTLAIDAVHWYPVIRVDPSGSRHAELVIDSYTHLNHPLIKMHPLGGSEWGLGCRMDHRTSGVQIENQSEVEDRQLIMAFLGLISSPGVTETRQLRPSTNRSARRREGDVAAVRLIYLRGGDRTDHAGASNVYHHRWVVSGHWRSQPYGPGSTLRRPVWIRPHVKGPAGAPLLTGEKVTVIT